MARMLSLRKQALPIFFCLNLAVFYFYEYALRTMPSVLHNGLYEAYQLSFSSFGYLCAAFYLVYVPMQLLVGLFIDRMQFMRFLSYSVVLGALGCCLFANANSLQLALLGRLLMGLGTSFIFVVILKRVALKFSERRFTFYLGLTLCVGMLGGLLMDSVLALILQSFGWRLVCYSLSALGLVLVFFDRPLAIQQRLPKKSLMAEAKTLISYVIDRRLWVHCLIGALLYLPIAGFAESWGIYFIKQTSQLSHLSAAVDMSFLFLGFACGAPILGWLYDRTLQHQLILTVGTIGVTILLSVIIYVPELSSYKIGLSLFLLGLFSSSVVVILALNRKLANREDVGKVFAVTNFFMMLAGGGAWLIGELIHFIVRHELLTKITFCSLSDFQLAFLLLPAASLLAFFLTFYTQRG